MVTARMTLNFIHLHKYKLLIAVVVLLGVLFLGNRTNETESELETLPLVTVSTPAALSNQEEILVIGTVRAFSEAAITSEATGRVTTVNVSLGQTIPAGYIIASLENASERATVLQAEGAYEATLATVQQNNVSVNEAETNLQRVRSNAVITFQSAYNTINGIILNNIDEFFANPDSKVPGVKIDNMGKTTLLNSERVAFQKILTEWQFEADTLTRDSDLQSALQDAVVRVDRTIVLLDTFIEIFNENSSNRRYSDTELNSFSTNFTLLKSTLQATKNQINNEVASIESALDTVRKAKITASGSTLSVSDGQVKQALGSLLSAQANLAKTILRSPVSGTINSLDVRVGDYVANQQVVAKVANNNALEVITYVGDKEISAFSVGSTVLIEDDYEGTVTAIAPAVDSVTRKTEVRIALETNDIKNGDTVRVSKVLTSEANDDETVTIPLTAVKFEIDDGYIFIVEDGKLVSKPVELGVVRGGSVEVVAGLSPTDQFVTDARGLVADTKVEVRNR